MKLAWMKEAPQLGAVLLLIEGEESVGAKFSEQIQVSHRYIAEIKNEAGWDERSTLTSAEVWCKYVHPP